MKQIKNPIKPITPIEVEENLTEAFPPEVIEAFNAKILENYINGEAIVRQKDITEILCRTFSVKKVTEMIQNGRLNIEGVYHRAGWEVRYSKPSIDEEFCPYFTFRKKSNG